MVFRARPVLNLLLDASSEKSLLTTFKLTITVYAIPPLFIIQFAIALVVTITVGILIVRAFVRARHYSHSIDASGSRCRFRLARAEVPGEQRGR